jgi:gamma-D-glutamyl-L-lysine dipeptidyl-peptidase
VTDPTTAPRRALVRTPIAPMYAEPHVTSIQISQRLCGHEVELLDDQDDWHFVRGVDAYEGWIHRGFLAPAPSPAARRSKLLTRISLGCITELPGGSVRALPLGARLSPAEKVRSGEVIDEPELEGRFPRAAIPITRSAQSYFEGASYLWGGITPWGADCSGFVQTIFGLHGVHLPRDAWQQSESGTDAGALDALEPADLAFFTDREDKRVTHVAISLGRGRIVHLALGRGGFATETLANAKDPYVSKLRERFLRARRVL